MQTTIRPPLRDFKASTPEHQDLEFALDRVLEVAPKCSGGETVRFRHSNGSEIHGRIVQGTTQDAELRRIPCQPSGTVTVEYELNDRTHQTQMPISKLIDLHDQLALLEQECDRLLRSGLAEPNTWIEPGKVNRRKNWVQMLWCSSKPIFPGKEPGKLMKRKYIGKQNSPKHQAAQALYKNRKQYDRLTKQIDQIKRRLVDV